MGYHLAISLSISKADGDKSDNIDGFSGWGLKTIQKKLPLYSKTIYLI